MNINVVLDAPTTVPPMFKDIPCGTVVSFNKNKNRFIVIDNETLWNTTKNRRAWCTPEGRPYRVHGRIALDIQL